MNNLIEADKTGNWDGHLQCVQDLVLECDSLNYLRYGSWYLEKMRKLEKEYPETYQELKRGLFVVSPGSFRANSPDMRLKQTIQRSKKCFGGIIGQTRKLLFYKILAISKYFSDIIQPGAIEDYRNVLHHQLKGSYSSQINISIVRVAEFLEKRGNPFRPAAIAPLHNLSTGEMVPQEVTDRFIGFSSHGKNEYENFRRERFIDKCKNLSDTIHKVNLPKFSSVESKTKTVSQNIRSLTKLERPKSIMALHGRVGSLSRIFFTMTLQWKVASLLMVTLLRNQISMRL